MPPIGASDIYVEGDDDVSGEEDNVGAAKSRERKGSAKARRGTCFIPTTSIPAAATTPIPMVLNDAFMSIGMQLAGANQDKLLFNGATIRGIPEDAAAGSIGCAIFALEPTFFWEWRTANPGESFTLSFTNTHTAAVVPTGWLLGYKSAA